MSAVHVRVRIGTEAYSVPVAHVLEVAELSNLTTVPGAPPAVLGISNLRGQVLPVFELAALLGVVVDVRPTRMIVAEDRGRLAGLAVDEVADVAELAVTTDLEEADADLLAGSMLVDGTLVGVLDVHRLFAALDRQAA